MAPGERYTVVVDFTKRPGQWVLANDAATPYPADDPTVARISQLMRFDVGARTTSTDRSSVPPVLPETNNVVPTAVFLAQARLRTVQAAEVLAGEPLLGNQTSLLSYHDPVTETPQLNSTEVWAMRNHSPDAHPIHEHLVELYLVGRWPVTAWSPQDRQRQCLPDSSRSVPAGGCL